MNLLETYGKFEGDVPLEHSLLGQLSLDEIKKELELNLCSSFTKSSKSTKKGFASIFYHKIKNDKAGRPKETPDGFFKCVINSKVKFYTTYKRLTEFLSSESIKRFNLVVTQGYTQGGDNLRKEDSLK